MSTLGRLFGSHRQLIEGIGGIAVILFGLYQLGVFGNIGFLDRERKLGSGIKPSAMSPLQLFYLDFSSAFPGRRASDRCFRVCS
jgi:cytochrome c-type biogenesis protein